MNVQFSDLGSYIRTRFALLKGMKKIFPSAATAPDHLSVPWPKLIPTKRVEFSNGSMQRIRVAQYGAQ